ncbi:hypothetical protein CVT26_003767 [Gymnopilus dilepis]|uniref:Uncharacterized protein n=1 Tax=Gymnopilus dilepis TaxID=231916 RepID=A0A409W1Q8_9AGAR|nr:hypothetical protein CVT26_003767 [Gymnopilus dilepis]
MSNSTNTTTSSTTAMEAKRAEYARLFDLFERLASRRARQDAFTIDTPTVQELDPLLAKLSAVVNTKKDASKMTGRPRRNTVASAIGDEGSRGRRAANKRGKEAACQVENDDEDEIESLTKFPLVNAKDYPFTFRLMVHKLYKKEEWVRTIKEMLERSKAEYKSLAEKQKAEASATDSRHEDAQSGRQEVEADGGVIRFKVPTSPGAVAGGRRGRQRSQSVAGAASHTVLSPRSPSGVRSSGSGADATTHKPDVRALKKRCVGRRKSMSGAMNAEVGSGSSYADSPPHTACQKNRATWVYDAAISSAERPATTATFDSFPPLPPPSPTGGTHHAIRAKIVNSLQMSACASAGAGTKRRVNHAEEVPLLMPLQHVTNMNAAGLAARRRVTRSQGVERTADGEEEMKKATKRPFAG